MTGSDEVVVHIGDLKFPARRGLEGPDDVEDRRLVAVDPCHGVVARRNRRLLDDADDPTIFVHLGHTEMGEVGGILHL